MNFKNLSAGLYVPDGIGWPEALSRITHLGIGAHHDDLEFMAYHGILECYDHRDGRWFGGVVCTDGRGSVCAGIHADLSPSELASLRSGEQRAAAVVGHYAAVAELGYSSREISGGGRREDFRDDLTRLIGASSPSVIYTHNPADKHDTHISVLLAVVDAIRALPIDRRPQQLLGCEGWRDLDWVCDSEKVALNVSGRDHLAAALNGIFDTQIAGGKRYDLAVMGRRSANATFGEPRAADGASQVTLAMDLTPLIKNEKIDPLDYVLGFIDRFRDDVFSRLKAAGC
ncbi:MAG: hypothetical protein Fur0032_15560 [Terrimicrobiaceae bacterium]